MNKIKKGNLNYDQSGRAYPDNPELSENWDCIWKYGDKYYELVGDDQHKEWEEVNIYDQIINEAYINFVNSVEKNREEDYTRPVISKEEFVSEIKFHRDFSESWGLKIEEREVLKQVDQTNPVLNGSTTLYPHKLITITYNNETIEVYE